MLEQTRRFGDGAASRLLLVLWIEGRLVASKPARVGPDGLIAPVRGDVGTACADDLGRCGDQQRLACYAVCVMSDMNSLQGRHADSNGALELSFASVPVAPRRALEALAWELQRSTEDGSVKN